MRRGASQRPCPRRKERRTAYLATEKNVTAFQILRPKHARQDSNLQPSVPKTDAYEFLVDRLDATGKRSIRLAKGSNAESSPTRAIEALPSPSTGCWCMEAWLVNGRRLGPKVWIPQPRWPSSGRGHGAFGKRPQPAHKETCETNAWRAFLVSVVVVTTAETPASA